MDDKGDGPGQDRKLPKLNKRRQPEASRVKRQLRLRMKTVEEIEVELQQLKRSCLFRIPRHTRR